MIEPTAEYERRLREFYRERGIPDSIADMTLAQAKAESLQSQLAASQAELSAVILERDRLKLDTVKLRVLLALAYSGSAGLYTDGGELQDNRETPAIDFRRDSPLEIQEKIWDRSRALLPVNSDSGAA